MLFSRQVSQFIELVEKGSFKRAAEKISITPSALSHGIFELEKRVGTQLVKRNKKGVLLTEKGLYLYKNILPIYQQGYRIIHEIKSDGDESERLSIGMDGFYYPELSSKLSELLARYGDRLTLKKSGGELKNADCDIFIATTSGLNPISYEGIYRVPLPQERCGLILTEELYNRYADTRQLIDKESLIQSSGTLNHPVFKEIQKKMLCHQYNATFIALPDITDVCCAVLAGAGACLISETIMHHPLFDKTQLHFIENPFSFALHLNRGLYFRQSRYDSLIDIAMKIKG